MECKNKLEPQVSGGPHLESQSCSDITTVNTDDSYLSPRAELRALSVMTHRILLITPGRKTPPSLALGTRGAQCPGGSCQ